MLTSTMGFGALHQRPSGANENVDALCHEQVEVNDTHLLVVLCYAAQKRRRKHSEHQSHLEWFSGVYVMPKLRHFHAFGCPIYVLDIALQSGQGSPKWKQCARLGVCLGSSLSYARSVALVLNPPTGHVSPQFHIKFDDFFRRYGTNPPTWTLQKRNGSTLAVSQSRKVIPNPWAEDSRTACSLEEEGHSLQ